MTTFSIITGVVTLLAFILQIRGSFPEYQRYFSAGIFFLFGLTVGAGMAGVAGIKIEVPEAITSRNILGFVLYGGTGLLIFVCFTAMLIIENEQRRVDVSKVGRAVSGFFIFILIFFFSALFPNDRPNYITFDEQKQLVDTAVAQKNFERALVLIEDQKKYLQKDDPRLGALDAMAIEIKQHQVTPYPVHAPPVLVQENPNQNK